MGRGDTHEVRQLVAGAASASGGRCARPAVRGRGEPWRSEWVSASCPHSRRARCAPSAALKDGAGAGRRRSWLRHGLIVAQVAGSLVLLCGATLCLRSMSKQLSVDLGYRSDRLATASLDLERVGFTADTAMGQLEEIVRRVALVPGVERVGVLAR